MTTLQIVCVVLAAAVLSPSLAHALEAPGKYRLDQDAYLSVQRLYYPGFTLAGALEPLTGLAVLLLLFMIPAGMPSFWLTLVAALALGVMHAVYWLVTHPVNKVWQKHQPSAGAGARFFGTGSAGDLDTHSWTALRDRWERSHMVRAALSGVAFIALVLALSRDPA